MSVRLPRAARAAPIALLLASSLTAAGEARGAGTGAISGTVLAGAEPVCVLALGPSGDAIATTVTDGTGHYTLSAVPAGSWTVEFDPDDGCLGLYTGFAFQFYDDASTPASATPVTVGEGTTSTGVDAQLPAGATVGGSVTNAGGDPLPGVCAILEDTAGRAVVRQPTDAQGSYQLTQLPPGRFIVQFVDDDCAREPASYASSYYPGAATPAEAQVLTIAAGTIVGPVVGELTALPPGPGGLGGASGGAGSHGTVPASSGTGSSGSSGGGGVVVTPGRRRGLVALLATPSGRWTVDRRGRLHLRLSCSHTDSCSTEVVVRRAHEAHGRVAAGALLGRRRVLVRGGTTQATTVALRDARVTRVWIGLRLRGEGRLLSSVIPVRRSFS